MKALIIGGTGVISRAIVDRLLDKGHDVTIYNRGKKDLQFKGNVRQMTGDRSDREAFENVMNEKRKIRCSNRYDML